MTTLQILETQIQDEIEALQTLAKLQEDEESFHYLGQAFFDRRYKQIKDNLSKLHLQLERAKARHGE